MVAFLPRQWHFGRKALIFIKKYDTLLKRTNLIVYDFDKLLSLAEEIKRMLIASLNTAKENKL